MAQVALPRVWESWPWPGARLFLALDVSFFIQKRRRLAAVSPSGGFDGSGGCALWGRPHPQPRSEGCWAATWPRFSLRRKPTPECRGSVLRPSPAPHRHDCGQQPHLSEPSSSSTKTVRRLVLPPIPTPPRISAAQEDPMQCRPCVLPQPSLSAPNSSFLLLLSLMSSQAHLPLRLSVLPAVAWPGSL